MTRAAIATIAPTLDANMPSSEIVCFAESAALPSSYRSGGFIVNSIVDNVIDDGIVDKATDLNLAVSVAIKMGRYRTQMAANMIVEAVHKRH